VYALPEVLAEGGFLGPSVQVNDGGSSLTNHVYVPSMSQQSWFVAILHVAEHVTPLDVPQFVMALEPLTTLTAFGSLMRQYIVSPSTEVEMVLAKIKNVTVRAKKLCFPIMTIEALYNYILFQYK
jgi:hypothetical protein